MLSAGRLRHRITIEQPVETRGSGGEVIVTWAPVYTNVPAAIEPMSVNSFIAARQIQSDITTMIVIRYVAGLTSKMRIRNGAKIYNPAGFLPDKIVNTEYLTAPCSEGVNEG